MERENTYEKLCPYVERAKKGDEQAFGYLYHYPISARIKTRWKILSRKYIWRSIILSRF